MEFRTGYFAKMNKYVEQGYYPISIARFNPNGILTDSLGKTLEVSYQVSRNRYYPEEYDIFMGGVSSENRVYRYSMTADIRVVDGMQTLSAGPCKLSIYGYDGETVAVELNNLVEVTSAAIVDGVGVDRYNFDTQGEYLYVMVHGSQLEGQTLNLKITDEKGNNVSSESYEKIYMDSLVYKIHLDEEYRIEDVYFIGSTSISRAKFLRNFESVSGNPEYMIISLVSNSILSDSEYYKLLNELKGNKQLKK